MTERLGTGDLVDFARDGSVDLKGNPIHRSERGGWKACSFLVGNDSCLKQHISMYWCALVSCNIFIEPLQLYLLSPFLFLLISKPL
jgi:hypothetical protein